MGEGKLCPVAATPQPSKDAYPCLRGGSAPFPVFGAPGPAKVAQLGPPMPLPSPSDQEASVCAPLPQSLPASCTLSPFLPSSAGRRGEGVGAMGLSPPGARESSAPCPLQSTPRSTRGLRGLRGLRAASQAQLAAAGAPRPGQDGARLSEASGPSHAGGTRLIVGSSEANRPNTSQAAPQLSHQHCGQQMPGVSWTL